jgi:hypothetical protein
MILSPGRTETSKHKNKRMNKSILKQAAFGLLVGVITFVPLCGFGEGTKEEKSAGSAVKSELKRDSVPFHGKLVSVDREAQTFRVGARVFQVTGDTKIKKAGKPATLEDAIVGEDVGGYARKSQDGTLTVMSVRFGPKPGKDEATE